MRESFTHVERHHYRSVRYEQRETNKMWMDLLVRLRWVAMASIAVVTGVFFQTLHNPATTLPAILGLLLVLAVANHVATKHLADDKEVSRLMLTNHLALDVFVLTALFALAGGTDNPFVPIYLIHVVMAAVMCTRHQAMGLLALILGGFTLVSFWHYPLHFQEHPWASEFLLYAAQAVGFGLTAFAIYGLTSAVVHGFEVKQEEARILGALKGWSPIDRDLHPGVR